MSPEILSWARQTAGLSRAEAAKNLGIPPAYGKVPEERLGELETGQRAPTRPMLVKMAKTYRRPLVTFYLASPPRPSRIRMDFRTLSGSEQRGTRALLEALVRELVARQGLVHEVLAEEETPAVPFLGTLSMGQGVPHALESVREVLGDGAQGSAPARKFDELRADVEHAGVFVLLKGDLGNWVTALDTSCYRGLSLPDPLAPFIAINDNDARPAWSFSLLHEFVHLLLGRGYCSGARDDSAVERFCDDVASLYLLPPEPIDQFDAAGMKVEVAITGIADQWRVSRALVAFRLLRAGKIAQNDYRRLVAQFRQAWLRNRQQMREKNRKSDGAPNYYAVRRHRTGRALLALVQRSHFEGALSTTRAATVLGVKPTQLGSMLKVGSA